MPAALFMCVCICAYSVCERERDSYIWGVAISSPKILTVTPDSFCHYRIVSSVSFLPSARKLSANAAFSIAVHFRQLVP